VWLRHELFGSAAQPLPLEFFASAKFRSRRAQGLSRLAASSRPPAGLGLDWTEHGGILDRIGAGGARHIIGKFKPLVLGEIHGAGDNGPPHDW
jgi:hypothetical protein